MWRRVLTTGLVAVLFLAGNFSFAGAQIGRGLGSFGGEFRGPIRVKGKVLCTACTLDEVRNADSSSPAKLYEFTNGHQLAIFQMIGVGEVGGIQDASDLDYWMTVTGMSKHVALRMTDALWANMIAEYNLQKEVQLTGFLRSTGTFDVGELTYADAQ